MRNCAVGAGVVLAAILSASIACAEELEGLPLVYENDFEDGLSGLVFTDQRAWSLVEDEGNHALALTGPSEYTPPVRSPLSIARIEKLYLDDFILEADIKQTGREYGHRDFCVFFGYQGPAYFYYAHLATEADEHANSIFLVNDAARVSIAQERSDGTDWGTGYHKVRVVRKVEAGTIEIYFDDMTAPVMRATDKTFLRGEVGFGSFDDTGQIDNIRIWGVKAKPGEGSETKSPLADVAPRNGAEDQS